MSLWWLLPATFLLAWSLTAALRRYALAHNVIDVPNARSSHVRPTPRGGGVAIVVSFLIALPAVAFMGLISWSSMFALGGPCVLVAVLGFLDDHGHIAARWRLLGHFVAATWTLWFLNGLPPMALFGALFDMGWAGHVLAALYIVWTLNLYNFMDGIDGIASIEALCVTCGVAIIYLVTDQGTAMILGPILLACSVAGFLCWNFPPAKIFMGDAGSGFLGMALAIMSLQAAWLGPRFFSAWLILLGVFIVDATLTLFRRLARGDKAYEAHRTHAYQYAARKFGKHLPVTLAVLGINTLWLFPFALVVATGLLDGTTGLLVAYAPLVFIAVKLGAGKPESVAA